MGATLAADLATIEAQTDDIGAAGAGLTAVGLSAAAVDAIWDEDITDHSGEDTAGEALAASFNGATLIYAAVVTNAAGTDIAADIIALKAETVSILEDTGTTIPATLAAFATTADVADAVWDETSTGHTTAGYAGAQVWTDIDAILADTGTDGVVVAAASKTGYALADSTSDTVLADAIWNAAASSYGGSGTYGQLLEDAGAGADPWSVLIPGAYGAGTAGLLLGTTIPTSIDALPTNTELATALGTADDAVLAAITSAHSTTDGLITTVDNLVDTEVAAIKTAVDAVQVDVTAILADTNELELDWKNGGRLDLLLDSASAAGDPWGVAIPGEYGAGTAGLMLGTTLPTAAAAILADTGTDGVVLAANAITEAKIADNAFAVEHFADDCLAAANFGDDCFVAANFGDDCFVAANFGDDCFVAANFATDSITDDAIATGAIASTAFAAGAIDAAAIAAGAIDNATFAADVGSTALATNIIAKAAEKAIGVAGLSLTAIPTIAAVTTVATTTAVTNGVTLAADAITAAGIADNAFSAEHFAAGCIDNATFAADVGSTALATNIIAQAVQKGAWDAAVADHTTAATFGKYAGGAPTGATLAADIAAIKAETVLIVEDTGTTLPATLETIDNFLDSEVAAILADTNELQVDWADGGRLDVILDAVGAAPTAAAIADAVWDEVVTGHDGAGKAGAQLWTDIDAVLADTDELELDWKNGGRLDLILDAAASAGDPWITLIPGAYTAGMAGYIIGTNLAAVYGADEKAAIDLLDDADGGLADIHTVVNTVNTNVATTMADVAAVHVHAGNIEGAVTPEIADLATAVAAVKVDTAAILADTGTDGVLLAAAAVDAIWDEDVNAAHQTADTAGKKLDDAGAAADPWTTLIPGGYTAGMAGKIVGDNLNAPVGTVDTVVDALATELAKVPKSDGTATWNATAHASLQAEATDALNAYDPPTKAELDTAVDALPTAAENTAALLDHVYTDHTTTSTLGQWLNAVRTLLGHKSVENEAGDSVSYKATDDSTESGTMTWGESSKTRGRYTGW
jgi:hypothetical protein